MCVCVNANVHESSRFCRYGLYVWRWKWSDCGSGSGSGVSFLILEVVAFPTVQARR